jgi:hypothetical protein
VDGGLGGEAHRHRCGDLLLEAGLVVQVEKGRIDRRYASKRTGRDQPAAREGKRLPGRGRPEIGRQVGGAQHQAGQPRRRNRDRLHIGEAACTFDQADQPRILGCGGQQPVEDLKVPGRLRLGQHQEIRRGPRIEQRIEVGNAGPRVESVDAQRPARAGGRAARQVVERDGSGARLVFGGDGVLEIEDGDIGTSLGRLGEAVGMGCRREQPASNAERSRSGHWRLVLSHTTGFWRRRWNYAPAVISRPKPGKITSRGRGLPSSS